MSERAETLKYPRAQMVCTAASKAPCLLIRIKAAGLTGFLSQAALI
jgi:hypothetical protein